jgi:hypothetical protein
MVSLSGPCSASIVRAVASMTRRFRAASARSVGGPQLTGSLKQPLYGALAGISSQHGVGNRQVAGQAEALAARLRSRERHRALAPKCPALRAAMRPLWSQFWSRSFASGAAHHWSPDAISAGHGCLRLLLNAGAQSSKACDGATHPWVQIPPPPPLACDNDHVPPPGMCRVAGASLSFRPYPVSVAVTSARGGTLIEHEPGTEVLDLDLSVEVKRGRTRRVTPSLVVSGRSASALCRHRPCCALDKYAVAECADR